MNNVPPSHSGPPGSVHSDVRAHKHASTLPSQQQPTHTHTRTYTAHTRHIIKACTSRRRSRRGVCVCCRPCELRTRKHFVHVETQSARTSTHIHTRSTHAHPSVRPAPHTYDRIICEHIHTHTKMCRTPHNEHSAQRTTANTVARTFPAAGCYFSMLFSLVPSAPVCVCATYVCV